MVEIGAEERDGGDRCGEHDSDYGACDSSNTAAEQELDVASEVDAAVRDGSGRESWPKNWFSHSIYTIITTIVW